MLLSCLRIFPISPFSKYHCAAVRLLFGGYFQPLKRSTLDCGWGVDLVLSKKRPSLPFPSMRCDAPRNLCDIEPNQKSFPSLPLPLDPFPSMRCDAPQNLLHFKSNQKSFSISENRPGSWKLSIYTAFWGTVKAYFCPDFSKLEHIKLWSHEPQRVCCFWKDICLQFASSDHVSATWVGCACKQFL